MTLCRPDLLCCYYSREVFQIRRPAQAVVPGYEGRHLRTIERTSTINSLNQFGSQATYTVLRTAKRSIFIIYDL